MITAGIDIGFEAIKIVILKDGDVVACGTDISGGASRGTTANELWEQTLAKAGISAADVEKVVSTGQGKLDVAFADKNVTEPIAALKSAKYYCPNATMIVDAGADQVRVVPIVEEGKFPQIVQNQKCAAGLGTLVKYLSKRLNIPIEEFATLGKDKANGTVVNDGCIVFAELDTLELLNDGTPKEQVAAAINEMIAVRLNAIIHDKVLPEKEGTVLIGGLTKNSAMIEILKGRSGLEFVIPEDAVYGCALGAALIAAE